MEFDSDNTTVIVSGLELWDMDFEICETSLQNIKSWLLLLAPQWKSSSILDYHDIEKSWDVHMVLKDW